MGVCWIGPPLVTASGNDAGKCTSTLHVNNQVLTCNKGQEHMHESTTTVQKFHHAETHALVWHITEEGDVIIQAY